MQAKSLNCPNCGAAASTESTRCSHCNSRLATIACPTCFGMIFQGAKYCSHCGSAVSRVEQAPSTIRNCPRCRINTKPVTVGKTDFRECLNCEGVWVDTDTLQQICVDRERQAAVLGMAFSIPEPDANAPLEKVRYLPCPTCSQLMHRINFARCSYVVVDVCKSHGTWFDKDELRRIIEFIQAGGMDKAREQEIGRLERERRELRAAQIAGSDNSLSLSPHSYHNPHDAFECVIDGLAGSLVRFIMGK